MRVGVSLYVSPRFRADPAIRAEPRTAGALPDIRSAGLSAVAGALLPCLLAGSGAAQRDGRTALDPAQPDRTRSADGGGAGAGTAAAVRLDQAVSFRCDAGQCGTRFRAGQAVWRR